MVTDLLGQTVVGVVHRQRHVVIGYLDLPGQVHVLVLRLLDQTVSGFGVEARVRVKVRG